MSVQLVSDNSDKEVRKEFARSRWDFALRNMTSNLLRITAGAGKPHNLVDDFNRYAEAFREYVEAFDHAPPSHEFHEALAVDGQVQEIYEDRGDPNHPDIVRWWKDGTFELMTAEEMIVRGSLRYAASKMLGQSTQEAAGHTMMVQGTFARDEALSKINPNRLRRLR